MNVYTMPGMSDMGMVWMGANQPQAAMGYIQQPNREMLMDQDSNHYFNPSHHSMSNHSLDDMQNMENSPMQMDMDMYNLVDMKQDSNDGSYIEDDGNSNIYMISTATQTISCYTSRKIKPIKRPGLVLKTPIAYQSNTDPSVIPIQKDGIAVCQKCGAIGVKHAFYTRQRRFCSMACARGYSGLDPEPLHPENATNPTKYADAKFRMEPQTEDFSGYVTDAPLPQLDLNTAPPEVPNEEPLPLNRRKTSELANSYDWNPVLNTQFLKAAPVNYFKHAPMADIWHNILVGMKVEVENIDCENLSDTFPDSFWVATVLKIVGYKALLRYLGFGHNGTKDFWVSLCSNHVHPVGWCATRGKPLIPPKTIQDRYSDWKEFLRKRLTGARTLPSNFRVRISESIKSRFQCGLNLEVVDKNRISQVKVAIIHKIVGKRLNVRYYDMPVEDAGFWCHEDSPLLHPVGWAKKVGHNLLAPDNYLERVNVGMYDEDDATENLFNEIQVGIPTTDANISIGMKLEAIDPLNLSSICVATVMDVLNYGYIMIRIDTYESDATGADWFCYHMKSPCIFPAGFCHQNNIALTAPKGYDSSTFNWNSYIMETVHAPVPHSFFNQVIPNHGFTQGMKIEAADLMDPRLVCVATVAKVVGRLLRVHFDGWEEEYDQWLDCESTDIYPIGWCQSVGHKLEGPRVIPTKPPHKPVVAYKGMKKRGRKKKNKDVATATIPTQTSSKAESVDLTVDLEPTELMEQEDETSKYVDETFVGVDLEDDVAELDTGQNIAKTEHNLTPAPPEAPKSPERKSTTTNTNSKSCTKYIPKLIDGNGNSSSEIGELCPSDWSISEVAQFLRINDCANYCENFSNQKVNGQRMLEISKEDILEYTGGKVGPSLKIFDLIQQLKQKLNPTQSRYLKSNLKKFL